MEDIIRELDTEIQRAKLNEEFYKNSPMYEYYRGKLMGLLDFMAKLKEKYGAERLR